MEKIQIEKYAPLILIKTFDRKDIRLETKEKACYKNDWPNILEESSISELLKRNGEYGVRGGKRIGNYWFFIIDIDKRGWTKICKWNSYNRTSKGIHIYCLIKGERPISNFQILFNSIKIGDILSFGKQALGPASKHPDGSFYKFVKRGKWFKKFIDFVQLREWLATFDLILKRND